MKDGEVILVLGGAGGGMIPPAVVHAITRVIDFGLDLPQALAAPRALREDPVAHLMLKPLQALDGPTWRSPR